MLLVTEAEAVAKIGSISEPQSFYSSVIDHKIYKVNFVSYVPLFSSSSLSSTTSKENKYFEYLSLNFSPFPKIFAIFKEFRSYYRLLLFKYL